MHFVKMEGLGNDFIVFPEQVAPTAEQIVRWCDRRRGVGADGVLEVTPIDEGRVGMRYWNADGSPAEMCGNGLRCVARLAVERGWVATTSFVVDTPVGERAVEVRDDGSVRAFLGAPHSHRVESLAVAGTKVHPVGLGNPHAVLFVDDLDDAPVASLGSRIENDPMFPDGTNVEFARVASEDRIDLRVWERGVGETLACGTGAAATAFMAHRRGLTGDRTTVALRGGELVVELTEEGVWIDGPATIVFEGFLD